MSTYPFGRIGLTLAACFVSCGAALAAPLVTEDEAARPNDPQAAATRGITRGPSIRFDPPPASPAPHAPFEFRVHFDAHGGAKVDPATIRVTYLKVPSVDLTERLRPFMTPEGIDMKAAEVPPGQHVFRVEAQDSDGRNGEAVFTMAVHK